MSDHQNDKGFENSHDASVETGGQTTAGFDKRLLVLLFAAGLIVAACVWKYSQPVTSLSASAKMTIRKPSPRFELADQNVRLVKFERYLGRHRILLVFFDGSKSPNDDERLTLIRGGYANLTKNDTVVVAVSGGLPQTNRSGTPFPFPVLTDIQQGADTQFKVHKLWGSYNPETKQPEFKTFLIDRKGSVAWSDGFPKDISNPTTVINALINGQDPQL